MQILDLGHHGFVDRQATGGIDEYHVVVVPFGVVKGGGGNVGGFLPRRRGKEVDAGLGRNGLQLLNGRRAVDVATDRQHLLLLPLLEPLAELGGGGGLARALQAGHQDHRRRLRRQVQARAGAAHQLGQFAMHHADQGLARRQRADHFLAERLFLDLGDEVLDHRQRDVGFEQRHAHFAQHLADVFFGQAGLSAQVLDDAAKALGKVVEHGWSGGKPWK